jgi:hypothetical protein
MPEVSNAPEKALPIDALASQDAVTSQVVLLIQ